MRPSSCFLLEQSCPSADPGLKWGELSKEVTDDGGEGPPWLRAKPYYGRATIYWSYFLARHPPHKVKCLFRYVFGLINISRWIWPNVFRWGGGYRNMSTISLHLFPSTSPLGVPHIANNSRYNPGTNKCHIFSGCENRNLLWSQNIFNGRKESFRVKWGVNEDPFFRAFEDFKLLFSSKFI